MSARLDVANARAAWWTLLALTRARRSLRRNGIQHISVPAPPPLPASAAPGVVAVLRRLPHTCLERALVLQRWHASHGAPLDVVIGVTGTRQFRAHAWLEGEQFDDSGFQEITRIPAA